MLSVKAAQIRISDVLAAAITTTISIDDAAGSILAETILADRAQPPFDRVMMDGIAISFDAFTKGLRKYHRQGIQAAGAQRQKISKAENCIEVMTGAALPAGSNCIIPIERLRMSGDHAEIEMDYIAHAGQFIHSAGSDYQKDAELLRPGLQIGGPEMAVLASVGAATIRVSSKPKVSVVAVGDELVNIDDIPEATQIRRSNDYAINALLRCTGLDTVSHNKLPDDPEILRTEIDKLLQTSDFLVLTGGVSMGKYDYIPTIMKQLGVEIVLHKVAQRPGKPMWVGLHNKKLVFALPGNPVSALICARRYLLPAIDETMNFHRPAQSVTLGSAIELHPTMTRFVPVLLDSSGGCAQPRRPNTSGDFFSLAGSSGFVELEPGQGQLDAHARVRFWSWSH